jgi:hypothetical protein
MHSERARSRVRAAFGGWLCAALLVGGCSEIIGVTDGKAQGECTSDSECAPNYGCIQGSCRSGCSGDQDCDLGSRCLKLVDEYGCLPLAEGCGAGCATGTACVAGVCRTACLADGDCAGGQECQLLSDASGICVGTDRDHDEPPTPDVLSMAGAGGTADEPGVMQCEPGVQFCAGGEARRCANDGLASTLIEACGKDGYCDAETAACKAGTCAPDQPACDGNSASLCNASGSGFEPGGEACGAGTTCSGGACKPWVCTPDESFCKDDSHYQCSSSGLVTTVIELCKDGEFCQDLAGEVACVPQVCEPGTVSCDGNTIKTCNPRGSGYVDTDCSVYDQTCVAGACTGDCEPDQVQCGPGNKVQSCSASGQWTPGTACAVDETCVGAACTGECGPTQSRCTANNETQSCDATGHFSGANACDSDKTCLAAGGMAACGGKCGPTQTSCVGTVPQTCAANGTWKAGAIVKGKCGAACTPGGPTQCTSSQLQTCQSDGTWDAGTVMAGQCGAVCTPNALRCSTSNYVSQACTSTGSWLANGSTVPCYCWVPDRFKKAGTNLALDTKTGLIWEATSRPAAQWLAASKICSDLGMRLPTYSEWQGVLIPTAEGPTCFSGKHSPFDDVGMPTTLTELGATQTSGKVDFWTNEQNLAPGAIDVAELSYTPVGTSNLGWFSFRSDFPTTTPLLYRCVK